jgi:hypothetical protein
MAFAYWRGGLLAMWLVPFLFFLSVPIMAAYFRWRGRE